MKNSFVDGDDKNKKVPVVEVKCFDEITDDARFDRTKMRPKLFLLQFRQYIWRMVKTKARRETGI